MNFLAIDDYDREGRHLQRALVRRNIDKLTFRASDTVLDVGCGSGEETKSIAKKVGSVTGIDASFEMLAYARANNHAPNMTYIHGDALTMGGNLYLQDRFDKAVSFLVLNWIVDQAGALRSILACLKTGGEALFIVCNRTHLIDEANQFLQHHSKWGIYAKDFRTSYHFWNRSISETKLLLGACGWTNVRCELQHHEPITDVQTKLYLKTSLGMSARIPESEQEAYLDDMWQWALFRYEEPSKPDHVRLPAEMIIIHAAKPL
ncbi:ubiquinone biosynthesis O-methyltransferase-like [Patiria miniata]|uniref:Methyltransferase type 11 domain-containing protein n=1 Tax=Patiria miniata TaxID=46514 RepID=A0A914BC25_PATMI|nr:ubiquinone biosynthesis O-methyltransferase-like [Patiria miniata]